MREFFDIFMLVCFMLFMIFLLRGVALQTAKKDEIRNKFKKEKDERVID